MLQIFTFYDHRRRPRYESVLYATSLWALLLCTAAYNTKVDNFHQQRADWSFWTIFGPNEGKFLSFLWAGANTSQNAAVDSLGHCYYYYWGMWAPRKNSNEVDGVNRQTQRLANKGREEKTVQPQQSQLKFNNDAFIRTLRLYCKIDVLDDAHRNVKTPAAPKSLPWSTNCEKRETKRRFSSSFLVVFPPRLWIMHINIDLESVNDPGEREPFGLCCCFVPSLFVGY